MEMNDFKDQLSINNEIGALGNIENYMSHSSGEPDKYYFVNTDNAFTKKARILQAVRRWQTCSECGYVEKKGVRYYHPNLALNGEQTGCNFLHHEIFEYAKSRVANKKKYETIERNRLFNNFLSSQPMAFNLFFPLMEIVECEEGKRRLGSIMADLLDKNNILKIEYIDQIGIEFIPDYRETCLNDKTAMDAYLRYVTVDGKIGIIAIETKYTDCLGHNQASDPSTAIKTATEIDAISKIFTAEGKEKIKNGELLLSQIYRNILLTETVRLHEKLDNSISIIIAPKDNIYNKQEEEQLQGILTEEYKYKFQVISLESFVNTIIKEFPKEEIFQKFYHRYLDFRTAEWLIKNYKL
jgi:hypothetical protein